MAIPLHQRLLLLLAVLTAPFPARAITTTGQYTVTILGRLQQNLDSGFQAASINDHGVVAGSGSEVLPNGYLITRGVLWQSSTPHYTILGTLSEAGSDQSLAYWINNSGIAVGQSVEIIDTRAIRVPVIFTPNGIVNLKLKDNASEGAAYCINNYGEVVGCLFFPAPSYASQAFLCKNGFMRPLGYPTNSGSYSSSAAAINDSGLIVGSAVFASGQPSHAASYTKGAWFDLGMLPFSVYSYATSVNDTGTIVGASVNDNGSACFIYQNGRMTDLHAPYRTGDPFINNAGQVVKGNFIYQNGVWQDINDLDLGDGWKFSQAYGINNQGAIIGLVFREANGIILYRSALLNPVSLP